VLGELVSARRLAANACGAPPEAGAGAAVGTRAAVASAAAGVRVLFYATFKRQGGQRQESQ